VGVDSRRDGDRRWVVHRDTGDPSRSRPAGRETLAWVAEAVARGAGEIVLNSIDHDGVGGGYDLEQLAAVRAVCPVPLVASGGAGTIAHFAAAFEAGADAALAAGVFHRGELSIPELKAGLSERGLEVRR
jgi:cyclase